MRPRVLDTMLNPTASQQRRPHKVEIEILKFNFKIKI